jgi:hypothetical protein
MNGFIKRTMALLGMGCVAAVMTGCCDTHLCDLRDNCWPDRYNYQVERSQLHTFGAQVSNGHILDQTVWVHHFEPGTAVLTKGGLEHLAYLARRRPQADPHLFLQTAQDVVYDAANPEKLAEDRNKLNEDRRLAILRYLNAETSGHGIAFEVTVHDPSGWGWPAVPAANSIRANYSSFKGSLQGTGGSLAVPGVPQ